jgi:hypothetical protein
MPMLSLFMIACAIIALGVASVHMTLASTDICSNQIAQVEVLVNSSVGNPVAKPTLPQSIDAQLHHQPTQDSVRRADENARLRLAAILARAKTLNADGKATECVQSVSEARRLLGIN